MNTFSIKVRNREFQKRQNQILEQLNAVENAENNERHYLINNESDVDLETSYSKLKQKREMLRFRGKQSIFKKPEVPAPKNYLKRLPDFKKNPHKWTKYSLEDVEEVTSESNRKSALNFLQELANRKREHQMEDGNQEGMPTKIFFNKHVAAISHKEEIKSTEVEKKNMKIAFNGSTIVMPEYEVGQKTVTRLKTLKTSKPGKEKQLKLEHLFYEDEQE